MALPRLDDSPEELTATGQVILGMIALGRQTGYDIKALVDKTTRYFWAASYGQIYPELRRLEDRGLVRGRSEPTGGRARTVYELTEAGQAALQGWLASGVEPLYELRDEGMLKLFFSDSLPEQRIANIRAMRERQERKLAQLRALEPHAAEGAGEQRASGPYLTLQLGIASTECFIEWCATTERRLDPETRKGS
jgi:PadR family transcriptional regulator, regulatory protein AphA